MIEDTNAPEEPVSDYDEEDEPYDANDIYDQPPSVVIKPHGHGSRVSQDEIYDDVSPDKDNDSFGSDEEDKAKPLPTPTPVGAKVSNKPPPPPRKPIVPRDKKVNKNHISKKISKIFIFNQAHFDAVQQQFTQLKCL